MKTLIGAVILAAALAFGGPAAMASTAQAAGATAQTTNSRNATDISARRYYRHHYYGYRRYYRPYYYARPHYYRPYYYGPYPYVYAPVPFVPFGFGIGFGPWW